MSAPALPPRPPVNQREKYYFAYGSNLHLQQMAKRCPGSKYIGRACLADYRWMINERGFANIIQSEGGWVEGLVFQLNAEDERRLDRSEGVAKECYSKKYKTLQLHRAPKDLYRRPVPWILRKGGALKVLDAAQQAGYSTKEHRETIERDVLVYISTKFIKNGDPREEYVRRINLGVVDARALGVTENYIQHSIREYIPLTGQAVAVPLKSPPNKNRTTESV